MLAVVRVYEREKLRERPTEAAGTNTKKLVSVCVPYDVIPRGVPGTDSRPGSSKRHIKALGRFPNDRLAAKLFGDVMDEHEPGQPRACQGMRENLNIDEGAILLSMSPSATAIALGKCV